MRKRIYIAGPMRGVEKYNFPAFFEAEAFLIQFNWEVVSPARMDVLIDGIDPDDPQPEGEHDIEYYMSRDLPAVRSSKAIAMLPGWEDSTGANRELAEAIKYRKIIYLYDPYTSDGGPGLTDAMYLRPDPAKLAPAGASQLDDGKLRVELVPASAIEAIAAILGENAKPKGKYAPRNWEKGMSWGRNYASALRHLLAWSKGEDNDDGDKGDGLPHLWHAICRLAFLVEYARTGKGTDDRPKG